MRIIRYLALPIIVFMSCLFGSGVQAQNTPYMTLIPSSGPPGTVVTVSGANFPAADSVLVKFDGTSEGRAYATAGSWSMSFSVPAVSTAVPHIVNAFGSLFASSQPFTVTPRITGNVASGAVGSAVTLTGAGFAFNDSDVITFDNQPLDASVTVAANGSWTSKITVPEAAAGMHSLGAYGSMTQAADVTPLPFAVTAVLTLSGASGTPGSLLSASGSGFAANEDGISLMLDGQDFGSHIRANDKGSWTSSFVLPPAPAGKHLLGAYGPATAANSSTVLNLTVTPSISVDQPRGTSGTVVTVSGVGFVARESNITVTLDGKPVGTPTAAGAAGEWNSTFAIPAVPSGTHALDAQGKSTSSTSVPDITFITGPVVTLNKKSGPVGTVIAISGSGFVASEKGSITFGNSTDIQNIAASGSGDWSASLTVPPAEAGSHDIKVQGSQTLDAGSVAFNVVPSLSLSAASGNIGSGVIVRGSGFAASSPLRFIFGDNPISGFNGVSTDNSGSFMQTIMIPKTKTGDYSFKVIDAGSNESQAPYRVSEFSIVPPNQVAPPDGDRIGLLGDATPVFKWTATASPNRTTYALQVDTDTNFSHPLIDKSGLTNAYYYVTTAEALPYGKYYWRVKAVDDAGNQSEWSQPIMLQSGVMTAASFGGSIAAAIAAISLLVFFLAIRPALKRRRDLAAAGALSKEIVIANVVNGEYRNLESAEAKPALPYRLALPQAIDGASAQNRSHEDQARLEIVLNFLESVPLIEPDGNVGWLMQLAVPANGHLNQASLLGQILKGEIKLHYEPAWVRHASYEDLKKLLAEQPVLNDVELFLVSVDATALEAVELLKQINQETSAETGRYAAANGGWRYISSIYTDALEWHLGLNLDEPSDTDYIIKPVTSQDQKGPNFELDGGQQTDFAGPLIQTPEESDAVRLRALHLKLRLKYRASQQAQQVAAKISLLRVQRKRILSVFSQLKPG